jgi:hypothetical protein
MSDGISELVEDFVDQLQQAVYTEACNVWAFYHNEDPTDSRKEWDKVEVAMLAIANASIANEDTTSKETDRIADKQAQFGHRIDSLLDIYQGIVEAAQRVVDAYDDSCAVALEDAKFDDTIEELREALRRMKP